MNTLASFSPSSGGPKLRRPRARLGVAGCLLVAMPLGAQNGVYVTPFGARVLANPRVTLRDQSLRGIEGGFILGALEVAGHLAQASTGDFRESRPARLVGGSIRVPLPTAYVRPYLAAGASRLTFDEGFTRTGPTPRDRWVAEVGGGVLVPLYSGFKLDIGVRDLVLRADSAAGPLDTTRILTHNVQLRVGLRVQFGGPRPQPRPTPTVVIEQGTARQPTAPPTRGAPAAQPAATVTPVPVTVAAPGAPTTQVLVRTTAPDGSPALVTAAPATLGAPAGMVSFPAPVTGEVTIRYGAPAARVAPTALDGTTLAAGANAAIADTTLARLRRDLDRALTQLLRPAPVTRTAPARRGARPSPSQAPSPLQQFVDSVRLHDAATSLQRYVDAYGTNRTRQVADSMAGLLVAERDARTRLALRVDSLVALRALDDADAAARRSADSAAAAQRDLVSRDPLLLATGVSVGIGTEVVVGARMHFGTPVRRLRALHLVGDVGVGAGTLGTSTAISGLAQYRLPPLAGVHAFVEAGLGLVNLTTPRAGLGRGLSLVPDAGLGAHLPVGARDAQGRGRLIVLWRGLNASRVNRLLVGWSLR